MNSHLTIFAASYLVFIDAVLAAIVIGLIAVRRSRGEILTWILMAGITLVLSYVFAKIGAAVFTDTRPFVTDHVTPLVKHAAGNGFPSDHALLAAAIVALVFFVSPWYAIPFAILAFLVDWARVGAGLHHVGDVVGSTLFVLLAAIIAALIAPPLARVLSPRIPQETGSASSAEG